MSVISVGLRTVLSAYILPTRPQSHENAYIIADVSLVVYRLAVYEGTDIQFVCPRARVKCELRVAKLRVGILRVEVRASTRLVSYF